MNIKNINILVISIFLLVFAFAVLAGEQSSAPSLPLPQNEVTGEKQPETPVSFYLESGETLIVPVRGKIVHSGFSIDDPRQRMVAEAYDLGGIGFVALLECENGLWDPRRVGDGGDSHGLCMLNTRWHKEPFSPERNDRTYQLSICYQKRKGGTKFYGPQRFIGGKKCSEVAKERFYFL